MDGIGIHRKVHDKANQEVINDKSGNMKGGIEKSLNEWGKLKTD